MNILNTPVLFLVFNRPGSAQKVFEAIRYARPKQLFIAADGPRAGKAGEKEICAATRAIATGVDWDCEVRTLFRDENLGCGPAVSSAISWFFDHVKSGIILEDDCLPNRSFFLFCEAMLKKFEKDEHVMHISGNNFQFSNIGNECYYRTKLPHIWGWATWKRAWKNYDFRLSGFNEDSRSVFFDHAAIDNYWHFCFTDTKKRLHTWDYQWVNAVFRKNGFCIAPQYNLVSNIGYTEEGTHITDSSDYLSNLKSYEMPVPEAPGDCDYIMAADINEQVFFNWMIEEDMEPNVSMRQILKITGSKILHKLRRPST